MFWKHLDYNLSGNSLIWVFPFAPVLLVCVRWVKKGPLFNLQVDREVARTSFVGLSVETDGRPTLMLQRSASDQVQFSLWVNRAGGDTRGHPAASNHPNCESVWSPWKDELCLFPSSRSICGTWRTQLSLLSLWGGSTGCLLLQYGSVRVGRRSGSGAGPVVPQA